ncbi:MAG: hypothetical protein MO853_01285 [Candidatus Protistobacter heckmanni]|nr:hypothetical protein [Candidatus Protistobacter heckmanni]
MEAQATLDATRYVTAGFITAMVFCTIYEQWFSMSIFFMLTVTAHVCIHMQTQDMRMAMTHYEERMEKRAHAERLRMENAHNTLLQS